MSRTLRWNGVPGALAVTGLLALGLTWGLRPAEPGSGGLARGAPAPPLVGKTLAGPAFDLAALRDKRAALVVFWASW
ncbi:MAG: hypothetical protein VKQ33_01690 [Candidatus Sericytochromatia bacterium]|nr:hypothetical protein [Candidatus Sericytochromatia bacterium]